LANGLKKEELLRRAIALCPSHGIAHNNLGDVLEKQGRAAEAIASYTEAVRLTGAAIPMFGVADVYLKTGRPLDALQWYEKGLAIDPGDKMSIERAAVARDLITSPLVSAATMRSLIGTDRDLTRGPGEVVSIAFADALIPFDFNSAAITDRAKRQLAEIGRAVASMTSGVLEVSGHTDLRGGDAFNLSLAGRRAGAVVAYLEKYFQLPSGRLVPRGYGERAPICTVDTSESCHALNRRVELVRRPGMVPQAPPGFVKNSVTTRGVQLGERVEPVIALEVGFFTRSAGGRIARLTDETSLRSKADRYFVFFRPSQDCYVYVLQEDSQGSRVLLHPSASGNASVRKGSDNWVPGFGMAYTLDDQVGDEVLYVVATSFPLEASLADGVSLAQRVEHAVPVLTRSPIIKAVPPVSAPQSVTAAELGEHPGILNALLDKVRGEGGWVTLVRFKHEPGDARRSGR
jgi:outer membrane protein OmpA-like peptidoglycan-associated protein